MLQSSRPGEDGGDGIGRGLLSLLVLAVMPGHGAVSGLGLDRLSVGANQHRGHETQGAVALGNYVGLDVAVVVLAGPDKLAAGFQGLGDHVVDQAVLVPDSGLLEIFDVLTVREKIKDLIIQINNASN